MMITRNITTDGNLNPAACNIFQQLPDKALFFVQQQIRHPASIYSLSLEKLHGAFTRVLEEYLLKTAELKGSDGKQFDVSILLRNQEELLKALQEHIEDCYLVLKSLIDPNLAKKSSIFTSSYVLENKLPGAKPFEQGVLGYKNSLRIANKLKHQQGRLRAMAVWPDSRAFLGYFLEEPDKSGAIGPSPEIHPDQGAISFARDLPFHLFNVYLCSEKLVTAVSRAVEALHGIKFPTLPATPNSEWDRLLVRVSAIPLNIFPKEIGKRVAGFHLDQTRGTLRISFPEAVRIIYPSPIRASVLTAGDGYSKTFKLPLP